MSQVMQKIRCILFSSFLLFISGFASALPIQFVWEGTGSGSLDNLSFEDVSFRAEILADTDDIILDGDVVLYENLSGTIGLFGIGLASFVEPLYVYRCQDCPDPGWGDVGFGDYNNYDLLSVRLPGVGLDTYDLISPFGPVYDPLIFHRQFTSVLTNIGALSITNAYDGSFQAFMPPRALVPSPNQLSLIAAGLLGLISINRKRRR